MNTALLLRYDGTRYHGWQWQKNAVSVCETLTKAIEKTIGGPVKLHGCGRTDAGVHARHYVANFRAPHRVPLDRLPFALNGRLPPDIAVMSAAPVSERFHSIASCEEKEYTYYVYPTRHRDPFWEGRALTYTHAVRLDVMRAAAGQFVGRHDFACVRSVGTPVKSTVRTLFAFDIVEQGALLAFVMRADGFLYNMARALVGSVLYANEGKLTDIGALLASGDRCAAGPTAPAHGLYMTNVRFDEDVTW